MMAPTERARDALHAIPPDLPREDWHRVGRAAIAAGLTVDDLVDWSSNATNFKSEQDVRASFRTVKADGGTTEKALFRTALDSGWQDPDRKPGRVSVSLVQARTAAKAPPRPPKPPQAAQTASDGGKGASELWNRCSPPPADHPYIFAKAGVPDGLRVVPQGDPLRQAGESWDGALVVPVLRPDGSLSTVQLIAPPALAERLKAKGKQAKQNLAGAHLEGWFTVGQVQLGGVAYLCEGIGTAWACWKATGAAAVVCFGWGRVRKVAEEMRQRDASARLVLVPDVGKEADADAIAQDVGALVAKMPEGWPQNADANDLGQRDGFDVLEALLSASASNPPAAPLRFAVVPFADLSRAEPEPPVFVWDGLVPAGHVTLLAAHGGTGKSMVALMLAVCAALGLPLFGIPTRCKGPVAFYSGEDGAGLLRYRLRQVCRGLGVSVDDLQDRLFVLDATDDDPTLFAEVTTAGRREGMPTGTYDGLREFANAKGLSLLVVDNASDAFDASEIDRARVRGFMRALARIARERDAGVLLLAHVDKGTSRGERTGTEGYSGSTAWSNSARSRLFMTRDKDGTLLLEHQKHNLGRLREPLRLVWPEGGIPQADEAFGPVVQGIADRGNEKALLKLIAEYTARGELVTTATTSRTHAGKLLRHEPTFPRIKDGEVFDLLRRAERAGHLVRLHAKGSNRHEKECWQVTASGAAFAGIPAPTAPTAPTAVVSAPDAASAEGCADCADFSAGGTGERRAHNETAGAGDA